MDIMRVSEGLVEYLTASLLGKMLSRIGFWFGIVLCGASSPIHTTELAHQGQKMDFYCLM